MSLNPFPPSPLELTDRIASSKFQPVEAADVKGTLLARSNEGRRERNRIVLVWFCGEVFGVEERAWESFNCDHLSEVLRMSIVEVVRKGRRTPCSTPQFLSTSSPLEYLLWSEEKDLVLTSYLIYFLWSFKLYES